jgi:hypothetical protein
MNADPEPPPLSSFGITSSDSKIASPLFATKADAFGDAACKDLARDFGRLYVDTLPDL